MRRGTSLLEALLALLLFEFGLLALLGAAVMSARDLGSAGRRLRAQTIAKNRVEQLRLGGCAAPSSGAADWPGGIMEIWRVERAGPVHVVTDSVVSRGGGRTRDVVVERGWSLCPP